MNRAQWQGVTHPSELWMAKLGEEFGEVARERVDALRATTLQKKIKATERLAAELEHVEFIARNWRLQIERSGR